MRNTNRKTNKELGITSSDTLEVYKKALKLGLTEDELQHLNHCMFWEAVWHARDAGFGPELMQEALETAVNTEWDGEDFEDDCEAWEWISSRTKEIVREIKAYKENMKIGAMIKKLNKAKKK